MYVTLVVSLPDPPHAVKVPIEKKPFFLRFTGNAFLRDCIEVPNKFIGSAKVYLTKREQISSPQVAIQAPPITMCHAIQEDAKFASVEVDANPVITCQLKPVRGFKRNLTEVTPHHRADFTVDGKFTLNNETKPIEAQAQGWREDQWLVVVGTAQIKEADSMLPVPWQFFVSADRQVDISFRLLFPFPIKAVPLR